MTRLGRLVPRERLRRHLGARHRRGHRHAVRQLGVPLRDQAGHPRRGDGGGAASTRSHASRRSPRARCRRANSSPRSCARTSIRCSAPGRTSSRCVLYEWRSLEPRRRAARIGRCRSATSTIWAEVIAAVAAQRATGRCATSIDRLLLFGALNWIARLVRRPRGALDLDALTGECIRFFLRGKAAPTARRRLAGLQRALRVDAGSGRFFLHGKNATLLELSCGGPTGNLAARDFRKWYFGYSRLRPWMVRISLTLDQDERCGRDRGAHGRESPERPRHVRGRGRPVRICN